MKSSKSLTLKKLVQLEILKIKCTPLRRQFVSPCGLAPSQPRLPPTRSSNSRPSNISQCFQASAHRAYSITPPTSSPDSPQLVTCTTTRLENDTGTLARVTIHNAAKLNIVNTAILDDLLQTFKALAKDRDLRFVVLTGEISPTKTPAFCGGADITEMAQLSTRSEAQTFITRIHAVCTAIRSLPALVIARIHGLCLGGGLEIAASCDLRFATNGSKFGMPEVAVGIPSAVEARLLANIVGWQTMRQLVYRAELFNTKAMRKAGLVDFAALDVVRLDALLASRIETMAGHGPEAMRAQKRLIRRWEEVGLQDGVEAGVHAFAEMWSDGGVEPRKYMRAFLERKRNVPPQNESGDVHDSDDSAHVDENGGRKVPRFRLLKHNARDPVRLRPFDPRR